MTVPVAVEWLSGLSDAWNDQPLSADAAAGASNGNAAMASGATTLSALCIRSPSLLAGNDPRTVS
jgi:hypothetical protein